MGSSVELNERPLPARKLDPNLPPALETIDNVLRLLSRSVRISRNHDVF